MKHAARPVFWRTPAEAVALAQKLARPALREEFLRSVRERYTPAVNPIKPTPPPCH